MREEWIKLKLMYDAVASAGCDTFYCDKMETKQLFDIRLSSFRI